MVRCMYCSSRGPVLSSQFPRKIPEFACKFQLQGNPAPPRHTHIPIHSSRPVLKEVDSIPLRGRRGLSLSGHREPANPGSFCVVDFSCFFPRQVLRSMITFQSGPQLGSLRPLEAGRVVFGKGSDQPPQVRMLHRHPPAHLPATAAGGGRGWAGQRCTGGGSRKQRALPLSEHDSRGFDPPLTRHFELSLLLCSLLPSSALGFLWAPAATLCTAPNA